MLKCVACPYVSGPGAAQTRHVHLSPRWWWWWWCVHPYLCKSANCMSLSLPLLQALHYMVLSLNWITVGHLTNRNSLHNFHQLVCTPLPVQRVFCPSMNEVTVVREGWLHKRGKRGGCLLSIISLCIFLFPRLSPGQTWSFAESNASSFVNGSSRPL